MLQPDFQKNSDVGLKSSHVHNPKLRVEYSGGFRKFQGKKTNEVKQKQLTLSKTKFGQKQNQIINYVDQIGIQNLTNYYQQTIEDTSKLLFEKFKNQQQQSVVRLYKNLYPTRKSRVTQTDNQSEQNKKIQKFASQVWKIDKKFQSQPIQYIFRKQIQKIHKKYIVQLRAILDRKKISQNQLCFCQYQLVLSCFLIQDHQNLLKVKKSGEKIDVQVQVFNIWKKFLNTTNFKYLIKKYEKKSIKNQTLLKLKYFSKYLYSMIDIKNLKTQNQILDFKLLCSLINVEPSIPSMEQMRTNFQTNLQYTSPFLVEYDNKIKKKSKNLEQDQNQSQQYVFKANPVPKSTYVYYEKNKTQPKTTVVNPFNLTEKGVIMTPEQYYMQQKPFKAQPIPQSNSKPFKPQLLSKQQIKARALLNLQKSNYPKTMEELKNYQQVQKMREQQLKSKHVKNYQQTCHPNQIPNFDRLHAQQIVLLQNRKQKNKKNIQIKPFNLSLGKKTRRIEQNNYVAGPIIHQYIPPKERKASRSTKKFDAYVKFRNEKQMKRKQKREQEQQEKQKKIEKKKPYVQIIKQQMQEELQGHPRAKSNYDKSLPQRIEVDRQKIYRQKPLLMKSSLPPQQHKLEWQPIF